MPKILILLFIFISTLFAEKFEVATQNCELYNNLKQTKNTGAVHLKTGEKYRIIDAKNEAYYISVSGISIPNRWVDKKCFTPERKELLIPKKSQKILLALSWQNAFCEIHRYVKECKRVQNRYTNTRFGLHGLWPQPRDNIYCNVSSKEKKYDKTHQWQRLPSLELSEKSGKLLEKVMPGFASYLQRHEWIKHGTCTGLTPDTYFIQAIEWVEQINDSKLGQFFTQNIGKIVTLQQVRFKMNESFGMGSGKRIELRCKQGLISELWIHLGSEGESLKERLKTADVIGSKCKQGRIDRVGF